MPPWGQKHFSGSLSVHRQGVEDVRPSGHLVISLASFPAACFSQTFHAISAGTSRERKGQCKPSPTSRGKITKHQFWVAFAVKWTTGRCWAWSALCCKVEEWEIWLLGRNESSKQCRDSTYNEQPLNYNWDRIQRRAMAPCPLNRDQELVEEA